MDFFFVSLFAWNEKFFVLKFLVFNFAECFELNCRYLNLDDVEQGGEHFETQIERQLK